MRRRLLIGRALVHQPRLVLLDEPTVGLDPQVRQELWTLIDGLRAEGVTVLMSTHYIEEAERLADSRRGHVARGGSSRRATPTELVRRARRASEVRRGLRTARAAGRGDRARPSAAGGLSRRSGPAVAILRAESLDGEAPEGERRAATLEDAFVVLTGQEIE